MMDHRTREAQNGGGEINNENKVNRSEVMVTQERVPRTAVLKSRRAGWGVVKM